MSNSTKKIISAILAASLLISAMFSASCGSQPSDTSKEQESVTTEIETQPEETLSELEMRRLVKDDLPENDFDGYEFRVVIDNYGMDAYDMPEPTGDIIDDAVYQRNFNVSERYNVSFTFIQPGDYSATGNFMQKAVLAADDAFDLGATHVVNTSSVALKKVFMNWYDIPYVNLENPWWSRSNIEDLTYDGVALLTIGDYVLNSVGGTYCMYFNRQEAENYNLGNMYEVVSEGKWTIDRLSETTKEIYQDLNGDGQRTLDDFYGFATGVASNIGAYLWAFNNPVCKRNNDGTISVTVKTEKMNSIVEKLNKIMWENTGTYYGNNPDHHHSGGGAMFRVGKALFANSTIGTAVTSFRELEADYGIIPYPKWDEEQKDYRSLVDGSHGAEVVPITIQNPERTGIIIEALNAESYRQVIPIYIETALKVKYARDAECVEVLDMLIANRFFDFGYVYDGWNGASFWLEGMIQKKDSDFESFYAKNEKKMLKHYEKVFDIFAEYAEG
ncbi:MAG TPA: hypothetical protein GX704_04950 [Clostridiales bacterium]|jgi:hypothetical protein|nr:hypothetical protein [Clostridiales bacterium]